MNNHHATLSPSSFPALMECACFKSGSDDSYSGSGTIIHDYLADLVLLGQECEVPSGIEPDHAECCRETAAKALEFCSDQIPRDVSETGLLVEQRLQLFDDSGKEITHGTADVLIHFNHQVSSSRADGGVLVMDWKSDFGFNYETADYLEQTATYALMAMRKYGVRKALCVEAFVMPKRLKTYWLNYNEAAAIVECVIARRLDPERKPQPCNYCKWCADLLFCPAVNRRLAVIKELFPDLRSDSELSMVKILSPGTITDEKEMSIALTFARAILHRYAERCEKIVERINDAALLMSESKTLPGYIREVTPGRKVVTDLNRALELSGLTPEQFIPALTASLPKLADAYAAANGMKKAPARKDLEGRITSCITVGEAKVSLERTPI